MELSECTISTTMLIIVIEPAGRCFDVKRNLKVIKTAADFFSFSCTHMLSML